MFCVVNTIQQHLQPTSACISNRLATREATSWGHVLYKGLVGHLCTKASKIGLMPKKIFKRLTKESCWQNWANYRTRKLTIYLGTLTWGLCSSLDSFFWCQCWQAWEMNYPYFWLVYMKPEQSWFLLLSHYSSAELSACVFANWQEFWPYLSSSF